MQPFQGLQSFGRFAGTMDSGTDLFGYIKQDLGTDLLVMSAHCVGFALCLPPAGTRVTFEVVSDPAVGGALRADDVQPEQAGVQPGIGAAAPFQPQLSQLQLAMGAQPMASLAAQPAPTVRRYTEGRKSGVFQQEKGSFGFIRQDSGEADMFVMPRACTGFGGAFPPLGTRVFFEVVTDHKTGKPRAENCRPGFAGTMHDIKGNFGFIKQDSGDAQMFVMPRACVAFNEVFPSLGTRVTYEIVNDEKTGRPRAEDVQPMCQSSVTQLALPSAGTGVLPAGQPLLALQAPLQAQVNGTSELTQAPSLWGGQYPALANTSAANATSAEEAKPNGSIADVQSEPLQEQQLQGTVNAELSQVSSMLGDWFSGLANSSFPGLANSSNVDVSSTAAPEGVVASVSSSDTSSMSTHPCPTPDDEVDAKRRRLLEFSGQPNL